MKTYISGILGAVALAFSFVALSSAQDLTLKTDAEIEAMGYYHVYSLSIPDQPNFRNGAPYSVDNSKSLNLGPIESVAYRLNLGEDNFCYASFDTFTSSLSKIGVPTYTSHSIQQKYVHNLYYEAKSSSLNTTGTTVSKGNIEFWPWNYDRGNTAGIPNANPNGTNVFDFGDELKIEGEHGSMQVHDYQNQTTVFSFNRWNEGQIATLGIGNCTTANPSTNTVEPDWTFTYNANTYQTKQLDVYAKPVFSQAFYDNVSSQDLATVSNEISNMKLVYKLDCPLQGQYSANNYFINNASELSGMPLKRVGYYMVLEKADGTDYAYASFDAPTNNVNEIGLPFAGSNWYHQGTVSNMTVQSNVDGVVNGTGIATGNIEIWNTNYISNNSYPDSSNPEISHSIPGANSGRYDFGDERSGGDYACFQIHNYGAGQTVMALNKWNGQAKDNSSIDIGIGNNTGPGDPDYTFNGNDINTSNASKYQNRTLYVMAEASLAPCMENVDSASSYKMVQGARLTSQMGTNLHTVGVDYDIVNNVDTFKQNYGPFDRVGYYMEYAPGYNDDLRYVFVSFDAMTSDISKIGVPVAGTGEFYQRTVSNMEVTTNVPANEGLIYEPGASNQATAHQTYAHQTGYLEFWPSNYGNGKGTVISEGDDGAFDFNDSGANGNDAGHGSMQIHSLNTQQTIFALNGLNQTKQFGIGNNPNGQPDWTFDTGKAGYAIANIYTFAKPVLSDMNPEHFQEIQSEAANMELIYKMDCPLYGTYSADNYTINNANNLPDSMKGMPIGRVAYYMTLEKADGSGTDYAYASFDSVTNNPAKLGLPFDGSVFQGKVNNLTVSSNVDGVVNGTGLQGNIEMWNRNYSQGNSAGIPGANDSTWDFGDVPA
ncbi:MAG: hypothetical protein IKW80_07005, partial [Thermoguttaceae bacterium]|nr:hypothetical protein [Thermoguttaceae bacterium]